MSREYEKFLNDHGKYFCALPFTEIANSAQGHSMLCCYSETVEADLYKDSFIDNWKNSKVLNDIRQKMLDNKPVKSCTRCYQYEQSGAYNMSKRYSITKRYEDIDPDFLNKIKKDKHLELRTLDIKFGNKCNLACIMCDGHSSSLHVKEKEQHKVPLHLKKHIPDDAHNTNFHEKQLNELLGTAHTIQKIKFTGGEPTLLEGFREFIKKLSETKYARNISIMMVTNGTTDLTKMIDIMNKFQKFEVHWSTDGMGSTFEYIRWPATWNKVFNNQYKFNRLIKEKGFNNISSVLTSAIQLLNLDQLPDLIRYTEENNFDEFIPVLVMWPKPLDLAILPNDIKEEVINEVLLLIRSAGSPFEATKYSFVSDFIELIKKRKTTYTYKNTQDLLAYYDKARGYSAEKMCSILGRISQ
tara:strand:+ start:642 stop:1877 length:1236 start_codon:yes stop_codon:yes gene_type:complete